MDPVMKLDELYNQYDDWFFAGDFAAADNELAKTDPAAIQPEISVGVLTITGVWKKNLQNRQDFFDRTRDHFIKLFGETRTNKILHGLDFK